MTRDEAISKLCFREEGMWLTGRVPRMFVTVGGSAENYTDAELALLVPFAADRQAAYHRRCGDAKLDWGDNFISLHKDVEGRNVRWGRKRLSWREGRFYAASLPEAIAAFWGDKRTEDAVGDFCLLGTGEIVEIVAKASWDEAGGSAFVARRLVDDARTLVRHHQVGTVAIHQPSIEALADAMRMAMEHRIANRRPGDVGDEEVAKARAAVTVGRDPQALTDMWAARVLDWFERDRAQAA